MNNGKIFILFGILHSLLGISPFAFGKQVSQFSNTFFFKVSEGLIEFPLLNGQMNYETFAAFWFIYFGLLLIPIGFLVKFIEETTGLIPEKFIWSYLIFVVLGVYMIPLSGMTIFMLPHAIYMIFQQKTYKK